MALVANSLDGPVSTSFNCLCKIDTQDLSLFPTKILKHFDSATIKSEAKAGGQNKQLATLESISIFACHIEDLVKKRWPEFDQKLGNTKM